MNAELQKQIEAAVRRIYRSGRTGDSLTRLINIEIKRIVKQYGATADLNDAKGFARELLKELGVESWSEFKKRSQGSESRLAESAKVLIGFSGRIDRLDRIATKAITESIKQSKQDGSNWRDAARAAVEEAGVLQRHAKTEVETAMGGLDRSGVIESALEGDCVYFRYGGPSGTHRHFCQLHIGRIYHIDEIRQMSNGQGLPVIYYGGGYNCRHRWIPVFGMTREQVMEHNMRLAA